MKNKCAEITGLGYFIDNPFTRGGIGVSAFLGRAPAPQKLFIVFGKVPLK